MKPAKGLTDLAASLTAAASAPLVPTAKEVEKPVRKQKVEGGTMQMTLRPERTLYAKYIGMAAERSKKEGRTVSVQEIMLEVLEKGAGA